MAPGSDWWCLLGEWFRTSRRVLPWREDPSPYRVLVSEFMLQQTQVATVLPYFNRFLERFPTVEALAASSVDEVLKQWEGLGYYQRARRLHECACCIAASGFPREPEGLKKLPGIGDYTAAAISSIAFGEHYPVVDGNVLRVRTRMKEDGEPIDSVKAKRGHYEELLGIMAKVQDPSEFNQAMMELGALICHPTHPLCDQCPVRGCCLGYAHGTQLTFPRKTERPPVPHYHVAVAVVSGDGRILILKRSEEQMLGGLWEFPGGKIEAGETAAAAVFREVEEETGLRVRDLKEAGVIRHAYSHFKITMHVFQGVASPGVTQEQLEAYRPYCWIRQEEIGKYAFPKANHKIFSLLGWAEGPAGSTRPE